MELLVPKTYSSSALCSKKNLYKARIMKHRSTIKKRHELFAMFIQEFACLPYWSQVAIFRDFSDTELAGIYGYKVSRRGYFVR